MWNNLSLCGTLKHHFLLNWDAHRGIAHGIAHGIKRGIRHGIAQGIAHGIKHGITHGITQGISHGITHGTAHGIERGIAQGIKHGITHGILISEKMWLLCKSLSRCRNYLGPLLKSLTSRPSLSALADHQPNLRTFL